jgi:hypothetical protein
MTPSLEDLNKLAQERILKLETVDRLDGTGMDNYFGHHRYGYKTPDGIVYDEDQFKRVFTREK